MTASSETHVETIRVAEVLRDDALQVRSSLNANTVARYESAYRSGCELPPISVAIVKGIPKLIDGWHRLAALERLGRIQVEAEIVEASERDARWLAAKANLANGLPLKSKELRKVFRAYVHARQHRLPGSGLKSYREIAKELGGVVSYGTIRNWCERDFPRLFREMAGADDLKGSGGLKPPSPTSPARQAVFNLEQALAASRGVKCQRERGELLEEARRVVAEIEAGGPWEPPQSDF
jgi:uncharacterized ParB-like nuclease family protein